MGELATTRAVVHGLLSPFDRQGFDLQTEGQTPARDFARALRLDPETCSYWSASNPVPADFMVDTGSEIWIRPRPGDPVTIVLVVVQVVLAVVSFLLAPKPKTPSSGSESDEKAAFRFTGVRNQELLYAPVPKIYGEEFRFAGPIASRWRTEGSQDETSDITGLVTWGLGPLELGD